jgi:uncharacterized protein YbjT (DUF2867 family)
MILVTGATGNVGPEAVRLLRERGLPVRALVRDASHAKAQALTQIGAEVVAGDMEVAADTDAAVAGVASVVLVSPGVPAQELNVIKSAARAGVGHVVKASSNASADSPIARRRWAAEIEAGLAASGLPYTLLRSNGYMQNTLALVPAISRTSSFGSAAGAGKMGMVDARDVAAVAAEVAAATAARKGATSTGEAISHAGKTYWLTGPELITYSDVAAVLSELLGRTITYRELSFEENKRAMVGAGIPEPVAQMNAQAFSMIADGDGAWLSDDITSVLGRPARSFQQFAEDYAAAFS